MDIKHEALIFEQLDKITNLLCICYKYVEASGSREIVASFDNSGNCFFTFITNYTALSCKFISTVSSVG